MRRHEPTASTVNTPSKASPLLQVRDLTVHFPGDDAGSVVAADGVSFDINASEVVGLVGESGSGKTTTALSLLSLLQPPARVVRGSIRFRGSELLALDETQWAAIRGAEISLIFQEPAVALNPVLRVGDQIAEVVRAHGGSSRRRRREQAEAALALVGLENLPRFYDAYPHELSGGQRQRVAIAQALACRPALVVADEPTTGLDLITQAEIHTLLKDLKERLGCAFLLVSHDPEFLSALADRLMVMYAGRIVEEGTVGRAFRDPLHPYTRGLLGSLRRGRTAGRTSEDWRLAAIPGSPPDLLRLPSGCAFEPRCPERMEVCTDRPPSEVQPDNQRRVRCFKYGG